MTDVFHELFLPKNAAVSISRLGKLYISNKKDPKIFDY